MKVAVVVAALGYLLGSGRLQLDQLALDPNGLSWLVAAFVVTFVMNLVGEVRFWTLLKAGGVDVAPGRVIRIGMLSWSADLLLAGGLGSLGGDAMRVALLAKVHPVPGRLIFISLVDRACGVLILAAAAALVLPMLLTRGQVPVLEDSVPQLYAFLGGVAVCWASTYVGLHLSIRYALFAWALLTALAGVVLSAAVGIDPPLLLLLAGIGLAGPALTLIANKVSRLERLSESHWSIRGIAATVEGAMEYVRRPGQFAIALVLSAILLALAISALYCVGRAIQVPAEPTWLQSLAAGVPAIAISVIPLPADGLGVSEAAYDFLLRTQVDASGAILVGGAAIYLATRIVLALVNLLGLSMLVFYRHQESPDSKS